MFKFKRENNSFWKAGESLPFAPTSRQQNPLNTHDHAEENLQEMSSKNTDTKVQLKFRVIVENEMENKIMFQ